MLGKFKSVIIWFLTSLINLLSYLLLTNIFNINVYLSTSLASLFSIIFAFVIIKFICDEKMNIRSKKQFLDYCRYY